MSDIEPGMSDLIKRLRDPSNSGASCKVLVLEAADALEDQQRAWLVFAADMCDELTVRGPEYW